MPDDAQKIDITFPKPLDDVELKGSIILTKTNDDGDFVDLTEETFKEYLSSDHTKDDALYDEGGKTENKL